MTIVTEGQRSVFLTGRPTLINDEYEIASAWASEHIVPNKGIKWILGKYVEAENPNRNTQFWTVESLKENQHTIKHAPLNVGHNRSKIVGTLVASELVYPLTEEAGSFNPYIEVLSAFWKGYNPQLLEKIERAYDSGNLFYSMESRPESLTCDGPTGCGQTFAYDGPFSKTYCSHLQRYTSVRKQNKPTFIGGALIITPEVRPGWKDANISELAAQVEDTYIEKILQEIALELPEREESEWESIMWQLMMNSLTEQKVKVA